MDGVLTLYGTPVPLPIGRTGSRDGETYGGDVCAPHDQHLPPYCADDSGKPVVGAEEWCGKAWCWVDQDNCAVANTNFESNFPLTKMHWSYETCGDGAIATVPIPSIQAPQSCNDELRKSCASGGTPFCFAKREIDGIVTSCSADGKREWTGIMSHCAGLPAAVCTSCFPESKCSAGGDSKSTHAGGNAGYTPIDPAAGLPSGSAPAARRSRAWYDCSYNFKGFKSCDDNSVCSSDGGKTPCYTDRYFDMFGRLEKYVASCTTSKATYCVGGTTSGSESGSASGS